MGHMPQRHLLLVEGGQGLLGAGQLDFQALDPLQEVSAALPRAGTVAVGGR